MKKRKNKEKKNNRDFSLVVKINSRLLWRLFTLFLSIDIIFVLLFSIFVVYKTENTFQDIYENIQIENLGAENIDLYGDFTINTSGELLGWRVPEFIVKLTSDFLTAKPRYLTTAADYDADVFDKITESQYSVKTDTFFITYDIGKDIRLISFLLSILLIAEGLIFLSRIASNAKLLRRSLKPIYEMEQAARTINNTASLSELTALAGRINKIEAENLNSRIAVDSAQEELKGLADAINDLLERIEEAYRSQARFVSDASHELRTPISVIQGYANLLDRWGKNDPKTLQEAIDAIKNESDNMKDLIEQLLFLARGDNEALPLNLESFNLSLLAEEVYQESQMIDPDHDISFSGSANLKVEGDIQLIKQALRIFVDNSIKYTPGGELIKIITGEEDTFAYVTIQDNGIGMTPEDLPHIFDRFYRSDDSRARKTGGTGLGLSIAKWIIHRHNGSVEVLSRKDFGTKIKIKLPIKYSE